MSLLKKLFAADPERLEKKADAMFSAGELGPAKLAYEKAAAAAAPEARDALESKVRACCDGIARQRLAEAERYLAQGARDLAEQEMRGALEVAADPALQTEAQALLDGLEARDAQAEATVEEMSDEERIAVLMGQWDETQALEYDGYGEPFMEALLQLHTDRAAEALVGFESILKSADEPRYLWLEVGRARLGLDDTTGGRQALEAFLDALGSGENDEARLAVNLTLARLADDDDRFEEAMKRFEAAVEAIPGDYRPYLAMGAFLRGKGHGDEALQVLHTALDLSKAHAVDWRLLEEAGLASYDCGKRDDARKFLEQVIEFFTNRQVMDFPPSTATTLAELYEAEGRLERAADLYRALSRGSDREGHARYHYEAGRLLVALELRDEGRRMLTRAEALASGSDPELAQAIAAILQP
jgi:tetratricopeptide (TPR) repeat protein